MSYLEDLLGKSPQANPVSVVQANPQAQISGVVQAGQKSFVGPTAPVAKPIQPRGPAVAPVPSVMPAVPGVKQEGGNNLQESNIPAEAYQPAGSEKVLDKPASKLEAIFNPKVTGAYGSDVPEDLYKPYENMTPLEKAHYAQKYSETATSDLAFGPNKDRNVFQKVAGFALDQVDPIAKDIANIHLTNKLSDEVAKGNIDKSVFDGIEVLNKSKLQIFGDAAQAVLTAYTPGLAVNMVTKTAGQQLLKQGLKELAVAGLKEGSFAGLQYGISQAMSSGSHDPKEISKIIFANTVIGGFGGATLNIAVPAISKVISGVNQLGKDFIAGMPERSQAGFVKNPFGKDSTADLSRTATNSLENKNIGMKPGALEHAKAEIQAGNKPPVKVRTLEDGSIVIEDGRHHLQAARELGIKDYPVEDVTSKYNPKVKLEIPKTKDSDGYFASLKKTLNPINYTDDTTKKVYNNFTRSLSVANEEANQIAKTFKDIPDKPAWHAVLDYEQGVSNEYSGRIKQTFDDLHKEALAKGLDVPYRDNYVPQIYKNSPKEIKVAVGNYLIDKGVDHAVVQDYVNGIADLPTDVAARLKLTPNFAKARVLPDYQTAMKYGLDPKYTHPGQLAGAYKKELDRAVAGKTLIQNLVATGKLYSAKNAPADAVAVNLPFSGKGYYAEPTLAKVLNGQFPNSEMSFGQKLAAGAAKVSRTAQEIVLSGGVPNSDINFFSIGQLVKNITSGDVKSIPAFIRANFDSSSIKFFEKKAPVIQMMAQHGVDLSSRVGKMADMYSNMVSSPTITEALGNGWHRVFERKTFSSFMPQLQINTFEGAYKAALKKGLSQMQAGELAANTTKAFYGLLENTGRSKTTQDTLSSLFFAPKFREGVIRTLWNTGKSVTTEAFNPAYSMNRRLAAGMIISYGMYNLANKKLSGQYMWQNEPGHEFDLRIPASNGKIAYVPFMPSFLSLPRNAASGVKALATGDFKTAQQKGSTLLSQPVQLISQLAMNKDYFGSPIYKENDSGLDKTKDIAKYVGPSVTHPYMKAAIDQLFPDKNNPKPLIDSIMQASELPIKFTTEDKISQSKFYDALDNKAKDNVAENKKMQPTYDKVQQLKKEGKDDEAQKIVDDMTDDDYAIYKRVRSSDKNSATSKAEAAMYKTYQKVQELKKQGNTDEAQKIVDDMSDEDYRIYSLVKNRFN